MEPATRPAAADDPVPPVSSAAVIGFAVLIGVGGGLLCVVYYALLRGALRAVWGAGLAEPSLMPAWHPYALVVATLGGLAVGLLTRWLGSAGEIAAVVDNIHLRHGRIDVRQTPAMTLTSLAGIAAGGSAGPEAPLVQIVGSAASRLGDRLRLDGHVVRTFTFCGMGAALGAFFGAPLGGALFALEIPHRRGMEYYESLLPALVAAISAFLVFRSIVGYEPVLFHLPDVAPTTIGGVLWGGLFGAIGAAVAMVFARVFDVVGRVSHRLHDRPVLLATLGGLAIGLLAQLAPMSLFWGEYQIDPLLRAPLAMLRDHGTLATVGLLALLAFVKMLAIGATLHSGFRGGFIFPLMFVGATVGLAISVACGPRMPAAIAIVATMAAVNVAITKTPISTCVLLSTLAGASILPVLTAASVVSLLLTTRLNLIRTQRSRADETLPPPGDSHLAFVGGTGRSVGRRKL